MSRRPDRNTVERIAMEEAFRAEVHTDALFSMTRRSEPTVARRRAWKRILEETGCSMNGLADVWGCERGSIWQAQKRGQL